MQTTAQQPTRYKASQPTSLGETEILAGIGPSERAAFWRPFTPLAQISTQHYIDSAMDAADRIIQRRVAAGQITLLFDPRIDREQRAKRLRMVKRGAPA